MSSQTFNIKRQELVLEAALLQFKERNLNPQSVNNILVKYFENEFEEVTSVLIKKFKKNYRIAIVEYYMASQGLFDGVAPAIWETFGVYTINNAHFVYSIDKMKSQQQISELLELSKNISHQKNGIFMKNILVMLKFSLSNQI